MIHDYHSESHARSVRYPVWLDGICFFSFDERMEYLAKHHAPEPVDVVEVESEISAEDDAQEVTEDAPRRRWRPKKVAE